ncbi:hypothetical protein AXG93_3571s1010 [Marchantia polymorpha subsp. ruderalis]|uniref:Uncharacterized protein n=1 Tax=Marchantia polymorpha subsp. ruderalis TaxID=1480154 RepID=A0A176VQ60_MARPO|nr:hypothetical protein AXG93_3571s1010 [Marchantia polymorpha subsp. ruderalis]
MDYSGIRRRHFFAWRLEYVPDRATVENTDSAGCKIPISLRLGYEVQVLLVRTEAGAVPRMEATEQQQSTNDTSRRKDRVEIGCAAQKQAQGGGSPTLSALLGSGWSGWCGWSASREGSSSEVVAIA